MKRRVTSVQKKGYIDVGDQESDPKWTVQKGEIGRSRESLTLQFDTFEPSSFTL